MKLVLSLCIYYVLMHSAVSQSSRSLPWGINPNYAGEESAIDSVDHVTGNLVIRIPVVSISQRGTLPPFGFVLNSNSINWQFTTFQACTFGNTPGCDGSDSYSTWVFFGNGVTVARDHYLSYGLDNPTLLGTDQEVEYPYVADPLGGKHYIFPIVGSSRMRTVDGTGYAVDYSGSGSQTFVRILDDNGIAYGSGCVQTGSGSSCVKYSDTTVDPLGNAIVANGSGSGGGWTDSLGRFLPNPGLVPVAGCKTTQYPSASGTSPYTLCWSNIPVQTSFHQPGIREGVGQMTAVTSFTSPSGTYTFNYDSWGSIHSMGLPRGGFITYEWQTYSPSSPADVQRRLISRTVNDGQGSSSKWSYDFSLNVPGVKITAPDRTSVEYDEYPPGGGLTPKIVYRDAFGNIVVTHTITRHFSTAFSLWTGQPVVDQYKATDLTTWPDGTMSEVCNEEQQATTQCSSIAFGDAGPESSFQFYDPNDSVLNSDHSTAYRTGSVHRPSLQDVLDTSAGSPGSLVQRTFTRYKWQTDPLYLRANLLNLVTETTIIDGTGTNKAASARVSYDEPNGSPQGQLGLATTVSSWLNTSNTFLSNTTVYNGQGRPIIQTDPVGKSTTTTYQCNGLYPLQTVDAAGHATMFGYDCNTGLMTSRQDANDVANSLITRFGYDSANNLRSVDYPDGGGKTYDYGAYANPLSITITQSTGSHSLVEKTTYDGLGRVSSVVGVSGAKMLTKYDLQGRIQSTTNPYVTVDEPSYGVTSFTYDVLGRKRYQCQPDNGTASDSCAPGGSFLEWTYTGGVAVSKDENGHFWSRSTDALGRLKNVTEPGHLNTTYSYDVLSNLQCIDQWDAASVGSPCTSARSRSFTYDSLSRLVTSTNPETGTICYGQLNSGSCVNGYDSNGNLRYKTDARKVTVSYSYDALNRLVSKTYPTGSTTPSSCYSYDETTSPGGGTITNPVGRLTTEWTQIGACATTRPSSFLTSKAILTYDPMGRVTKEQQCTPANCTVGTKYALNYTYDFVGNVTKGENGIGSIAWQPAYDTAGRLSTVTGITALGGSRYPTQLFNATEYGPFGLTKWVMGGSSANDAALTFTKDYDKRMRVSSEQVMGIR